MDDKQLRLALQMRRRKTVIQEEPPAKNSTESFSRALPEAYGAILNTVASINKVALRPLVEDWPLISYWKIGLWYSPIAFEFLRSALSKGHYRDCPYLEELWAPKETVSIAMNINSRSINEEREDAALTLSWVLTTPDGSERPLLAYNMGAHFQMLQSDLGFSGFEAQDFIRTFKSEAHPSGTVWSAQRDFYHEYSSSTAVVLIRKDMPLSLWGFEPEDFYTSVAPSKERIAIYR